MIDIAVKPGERVCVDLADCYTQTSKVSIDEGVLAVGFIDGRVLIFAAGKWAEVGIEPDPEYVAPPSPVVEVPAIDVDLEDAPPRYEPEGGWLSTEQRSLYDSIIEKWNGHDPTDLHASLSMAGLPIDPVKMGQSADRAWAAISALGERFPLPEGVEIDPALFVEGE